MKKYCISEVTSILSEFPIVKNLARKKFVIQFVLALIRSRKVQFQEIAQFLNDEVKAKSNENRIQNFFRLCTMDYEQLAILFCFFIPRRKKVSLCIDRTEWDFGIFQVNILMIIARCGSSTFPLYFELLDNKSGNSHTNDRIEILQKCVDLLEVNRIGLFMGDREFIGHRWLKYLKDKGIRFCIRVPKHHKITLLYDVDGNRRNVEELLRDRKVLKLNICMVDGVWGSAYIKRQSDGELLYLFGTVKPHLLNQFYKGRWSIESFFQNIKGRGFDLSNTHLNKPKRLKKLLGLVCLAYSFSVAVGVHHHKRVKPIAVKNHGYKENSFSRKGINLIREGLRKDWEEDFNDFLQLILKFYRWIQLNPNNLTFT